MRRVLIPALAALLVLGASGIASAAYTPDEVLIGQMVTRLRAQLGRPYNAAGGAAFYRRTPGASVLTAATDATLTAWAFRSIGGADVPASAREMALIPDGSSGLKESGVEDIENYVLPGDVVIFGNAQGQRLAAFVSAGDPLTGATVRAISAHPRILRGPRMRAAGTRSGQVFEARLFSDANFTCANVPAAGTWPRGMGLDTVLRCRNKMRPLRWLRFDPQHRPPDWGNVYAWSGQPCELPKPLADTLPQLAQYVSTQVGVPLPPVKACFDKTLNDRFGGMAPWGTNTILLPSLAAPEYGFMPYRWNVGLHLLLIHELVHTYTVNRPSSQAQLSVYVPEREEGLTDALAKDLINPWLDQMGMPPEPDLLSADGAGGYAPQVRDARQASSLACGGAPWSDPCPTQWRKTQAGTSFWLRDKWPFTPFAFPYSIATNP